jgi:hypothetical protein
MQGRIHEDEGYMGNDQTALRPSHLHQHPSYRGVVQPHPSAPVGVMGINGLNIGPKRTVSLRESASTVAGGVSPCDIEGQRYPPNKNIVQTYSPMTSMRQSAHITADDYMVLDSTYRDRAINQDASSFIVPWASMSAKTGTEGVKQYYVKLVSACLPYNALWVNDMYVQLRVVCSSASSTRKFSTNNPNITSATFVVPMDEHRFLVPGAVLTPPTFIHLSSPMIQYLPFKVDDSTITLTWLTAAGVQLAFGNPALPGADNAALQTYIIMQLSEVYEQLLRSGQS